MKENRTDGRDLSEVVSIIGPGMSVVGDCVSDGIVRVEGKVEGSIKAAKSVVVGSEGTVHGDIETQDLIVAGKVNGTVSAESRVELQASCMVEGDIRSRRVKLEEGGRVEGRLHMAGGPKQKAAESGSKETAARAPLTGTKTDQGRDSGRPGRAEGDKPALQKVSASEK